MGADVLVRNAWYVAGLSHEFPKEKLHGQVIAEKPLVLWRTAEGKLVAFDNRCVHKRMPLSEGRFVEGGLLECAYHGLCYEASGLCVRVPSQPDGPIPKARLRPFPLVEQDGLVWVWPGEVDRAAGVTPPRLTEIADPNWETADTGPMPVPANSLLLIENLLDITHFYPLHDGNIGDVENSRIPVKLEEGVRDGTPYVGTVREVRGYRQPPYLEEYFGYDVVDRHHTHFMLSPAVTRVQMKVWPAGHFGEEAVERGYVIIHTHTPVDRANHVWRLIINMPRGLKCKSDPATPAVERFMQTFPAVIAEDRWALEKQQQMYRYPDDGYAEVFLKPDAALRRARAILARMERAEAGAARAAAE
ncbi:MAG TPA: aromatic ring-hydroxylating dioxygenase subunit alpha [Stellaceae bacterium]|nr:aromatic ring-hydroxylating dioxygenase subunit alpha [Stellaceae bacterium]